jgi:hypothetical protein
VKSFYVAVLFYALCLCVSAQTAKSKVVLSVCELPDSWKVYHGQTVAFRATYSEETVQEKLLDPSCPELRVAVVWPPHIPASMKKALSQLDSLLAKDSHKSAEVVFRGVFYGPVSYQEGDIPSNLPPNMKEQLIKAHHGYGYMSAYDYLLKVTEIRKSKLVAPYH